MKKRLKHRSLLKPGLLKQNVFIAPSSIHGKGLFARRDIDAESYIGSYRGMSTRRDGKYVLWTYPDDIKPVGRRGMNMFRYLNHSEDPNAEFDGYDLFALRDIEEGEEITFNYEGDD
jgi:SET domain-containing protein